MMTFGGIFSGTVGRGAAETASDAGVAAGAVSAAGAGTVASDTDTGAGEGAAGTGSWAVAEKARETLTNEEKSKRGMAENSGLQHPAEVTCFNDRL